MKIAWICFLLMGLSSFSVGIFISPVVDILATGALVIGMAMVLLGTLFFYRRAEHPDLRKEE